MKKVGLSLFFLISLLLISGCTKNEQNAESQNEDKKQIKIGCNQVSEVSLKAAEQEMKKRGYEPEFVVFSNNIESLQAVNDGNIDASFAQHEPFMDSFNQQKNGHLVVIEPHIYYTGIGLYSTKYDDVEALPTGGKIAIMNDAMNRENALTMLADAGLIKIDKSKKAEVTTLDIVENPKKFEFIEIEQAQTVRSLEDLDAATCFFTFMFNSGNDFTDYLIRDQHSQEFPISLIVKEENKKQAWAAAINESLKTDASKKAINDHFNGVFTFYEE